MEYTLSNTNITEKELREDFAYRVENNIDLDMEYLLTYFNTCLLLALENKNKQTIGIIADTRFRLLRIIKNNCLEFENNHLDEFNAIITYFFKNTNKIEDKSKAGHIVIVLLCFQEDVNTEILKYIEDFQERMDKYIENSNRFNNLVDEDLFQHIDTRKFSFSLFGNKMRIMRIYFELAIIVYKKNKDFVVSAFKKAINIMELYEYYFDFKEVNVKKSKIINLNDAFMESFNRDKIILKEPVKNHNSLIAIANLFYKGIKPKIVIENKPISSDLFFDFILFHKAGIIKDINLQEITKNTIEYNTRNKIVSLQSFMQGAYKIANHGYLREHKNEKIEISEINLMRNKILKNIDFEHEDILGKNHAFYITILDTFFENITEEEKNDYIKSLKQKEYLALYEECKLKVQLHNF